MPPKASLEAARDERKVELMSKLQKTQDRIPVMLELKEKELKLDHENDFMSQQILKLVRQIKQECNEVRIQTLAGVAEQLMMQQIAADQADDLPFTQERALLFDFSNQIQSCLDQARLL